MSEREEILTLRLRVLSAFETLEQAVFCRDRRRRAAGAAVCNQCGRPYYDHPADPQEPSLTILCDRERVKL